MNATIAQVVTAATGWSSAQFQVQLRPPLTIQSNNLYDVMGPGPRLIAKEYLNKDELPAAPTREFLSLQLLAPYNIAPQPRFFDLAEGPIVLYEFMNGEMWPEQSPTPAMLTGLAESWLTMRRLGSDGLWASRGLETLPQIVVNTGKRLQTYLEWAEGQIGVTTAFAAESRHLLQRAATAHEKLTARPILHYFCRSDPRFANLIHRPDGRVGMVDWEDAGLHDPAYAIAGFFGHANQEHLLTATDRAVFMAAYRAGLAADEDPELPARVALYERLLSVAWLALLLGAGCNRPDQRDWQVHHMPVNAKLHRFRARALSDSYAEFEQKLMTLEPIPFFPT
ncbi:MAG: phosphotransferase [Anaerolineales bacterium]|nr:phosphotransferase [Anaerolineales bacterium]MCB0016253.1 phosphotransferase [Anaerolineales bacterium]MCB8959896.1 phosphotransferase [Ardenticatenales bacterium]